MWRGVCVAAAVVAAGGGDCVLIDDFVTVFNVATDERFRGRGLGTALTLQAVAGARDRGCTAATLQSSAMGHHLYERIGFRDRTVLDHVFVSPERA